jgi:hypothetical protein
LLCSSPENRGLLIEKRRADADGSNEKLNLAVSMGTKSSLMNCDVDFDCSGNDSGDRFIRMMRRLLLSIMAAMARSEYLAARKV